MGSRVGCLVAEKGEMEVSAIICLGYPLRGINGAVRDGVLQNLRVPIMFVQGSKDGLCPLDKLQEVIKRMTTSTKLHIIEGGDHSFKVGKKNLEMQGTTEEKLEKTAAESIHAFLHEVLNVTF
ncbi:hypothetical protein KP509_23G033000 [Ceratopteris richardii]|nr:hypothetical protein KP509_23G033000 [Ceratopteris richardii]